RRRTGSARGTGRGVVGGAVRASSGVLVGVPRSRRIELQPQYDGTTKVLRTTEVDFPIGTRVEISFGPALPADSRTLHWAELAIRFAQGKVYVGRSSPWWYDAAQFHELL